MGTEFWVWWRLEALYSNLRLALSKQGYMLTREEFAATPGMPAWLPEDAVRMSIGGGALMNGWAANYAIQRQVRNPLIHRN